MSKSSGQIYIAKDPHKPDKCKVGMTTRDAKKRMSETENPDYVLHKAFDVPNAGRYEKKVHALLRKHNFEQQRHEASGRMSEWFHCSPNVAEALITDLLVKEKEKWDKDRPIVEVLAEQGQFDKERQQAIQLQKTKDLAAGKIANDFVPAERKSNYSKVGADKAKKESMRKAMSDWEARHEPTLPEKTKGTNKHNRSNPLTEWWFWGGLFLTFYIFALLLGVYPVSTSWTRLAI